MHLFCTIFALFLHHFYTRKTNILTSCLNKMNVWIYSIHAVLARINEYLKPEKQVQNAAFLLERCRNSVEMV